MYSKDFYITDPVGNNAFSYNERPHKRLFVPALKKIIDFDEIELLNPNPSDLRPASFTKGSHEKGELLNLQPPAFCKGRNLGRIGIMEEREKRVTFEEYDFEGNMQTCFGLQNLYETNWQGKPLYLVDNHNHVFYFWYLARSQGIITDNVLLYHIDEHADTRDPGEYLLKPDAEDLRKVFRYTNFTLNVGNYIIPAEKEGLIGDTVQIRGEEALKAYLSSTQHLSLTLSCQEREQATEFQKNMQPLALEKSEDSGESLGSGGYPNIILNLDLDFFEPELDFIDYDLKKQVILDIAKKADLITVCTSPYFIDQERALRVFKDMFD